MASGNDHGGFTFEPAGSDDWAWMTRRYERTAWESLPPTEQARVSQRDVRRQIERQAEGFRAASGGTFQALLAKDALGHRAGFVWMQETRHGFTGEPRAYVLELYVTRSHRGRGVGKRLMQMAEAWARGRGLDRIGLNVAAHNTPARNLYDGMGYRMETVRMVKDLGAPE